MHSYYITVSTPHNGHGERGGGGEAVSVLFMYILQDLPLYQAQSGHSRNIFVKNMNVIFLQTFLEESNFV